MAEAARNVKVSEKRRGKLVALTSIQEGTVSSFDGTKIFYRSVGAGGPPIICFNGLGVSTFFWAYLENLFRRSHQVITWDYRGHGKSELKKNSKNYNIAALVQDAKTVLDALKLKKAIFVGHSLGVQIILEGYRRWPERFAGMILCFGTYGRPMDHFYNLQFSRYLFEICYRIGTAFPKQSNRISRLLLKNPLSFWMGGILKIMNPGMLNREDANRYIDHLLSVNPLFFTKLLKSAQDHSAEDILRTVKTPTLIAAGEMDQFTPLWISKKMHRLIPDSEILTLHNGTHAALVEQPDLINLRIEKFIQERIRL